MEGLGLNTDDRSARTFWKIEDVVGRAVDAAWFATLVWNTDWPKGFGAKADAPLPSSDPNVIVGRRVLKSDEWYGSPLQSVAKAYDGRFSLAANWFSIRSSDWHARHLPSLVALRMQSTHCFALHLLQIAGVKTGVSQISQ